MTTPFDHPKFSLGSLVATPAALDALARNRQIATTIMLPDDYCTDS